MEGLIVAWNEEEIQAIDQENFHNIVTEAAEGVFDGVEPTAVTVDWKTETRDHKTQYEVTQPPQLGYDSCYVDIIGGEGGKYRIELDPNEMAIRQYSNDWVEELTYLEFRTPQLAAKNDSHTVWLSEIPEQLKAVKEQAVRAAPTIEW